MGGRGGSSGLTSGNLSNGFNGKWFGVSVTNSGGKKTEYFFKQNGKSTLMRIGLQATPKQSTITPQKFVENAQRNSRNVNIISPTETSKRIEKRKKERANKPDYEMGIGTPYGNKENRKAARRSRIASRRK